MANSSGKFVRGWNRIRTCRQFKVCCEIPTLLRLLLLVLTANNTGSTRRTTPSLPSKGLHKLLSGDGKDT